MLPCTPSVFGLLMPDGILDSNLSFSIHFHMMVTSGLAGRTFNLVLETILQLLVFADSFSRLKAEEASELELRDALPGL